LRPDGEPAGRRRPAGPGRPLDLDEIEELAARIDAERDGRDLMGDE